MGLDYLLDVNIFQHIVSEEQEISTYMLKCSCWFPSACLVLDKLYEQIQAISWISHNCIITDITGNKIYLRILIVKTAIHQRFVQLC